MYIVYCSVIKKTLKICVRICGFIFILSANTWLASDNIFIFITSVRFVQFTIRDVISSSENGSGMLGKGGGASKERTP